MCQDLNFHQFSVCSFLYTSYLHIPVFFSTLRLRYRKCTETLDFNSFSSVPLYMHPTCTFSSFFSLLIPQTGIEKCTQTKFQQFLVCVFLYASYLPVLLPTFDPLPVSFSSCPSDSGVKNMCLDFSSFQSVPFCKLTTCLFSLLPIFLPALPTSTLISTCLPPLLNPLTQL